MIRKHINGIHHTAISTPDLSKALHFYRNVLGFEEVMSFNWKQGNKIADSITNLKNTAADSVMLKAGNTCIELFEFKNPIPKPLPKNHRVCDHGITHIALEVKKIHLAYTDLLKAGMRFHCPPKEIGNGIKVTYGRDPDGNAIELIENGIPKLTSLTQNKVL